MNLRRFLRWAPMTTALLLAACAGGSGSSGFDISENFAIEQALDSQRCVDFEGLLICPAAATPAPTPTATPTAAATPLTAETPSPTVPPVVEIETAFDGDGTIDCPALPPPNSCLLDFMFTPRGFAADAAYRVAVREAMETPWTILPVPESIPQEGEVAFTTSIELERSPSTGVPPPVLQFAVLVFLQPPDGLPAETHRLADTGADFAYVTPFAAVASR